MRPSFFRVTILCLATIIGPRDAPGQEETVVEFPPSPPRLELQDGAVFVFLGDSITHQALYTQFIETFHLTRYPDRDLRFYNSGVGGDRAIDALRRFDADVARWKPDHVSVLLGMNDAGYTAWKQIVFDTYVSDMGRLLEQLDRTGAGITLMHPTMFDARASRMKGPAKEPTTSRYNSALAYYGEWCRDMALRQGLGFVDMHAPLNRLTFEQRRKDPRFTLIPDSVHPDPSGHAIMAGAMLDELFAAPGPVSTIDLQVNSKMLKTVRGKASDLAIDPSTGEVSFRFLSESLPWRVPKTAQRGFDLIDADSRYNRETIRVRGLQPGRHVLKIDEVKVGEWTADEWAQGINLAGNPLTPQNQQATEIAEGNAARNQQHISRIRNGWAQKKIREYQLAGAETNPETDPKALAAMRSDHARWLISDFEKELKDAAEKEAAAWKKLQAQAVPRKRSYRITFLSNANQAAP